jgi:multiple sugar transport system substrate-binding protein
MRSRFASALVAIALVLVAALGIAACGGDDNNKSGASDNAKAQNSNATQTKAPPATLRLWIMNNGPHPVEDTERLLKPFEQQTQNKVKVELVGWDVQLDRIRNAAVTGEGPDVTQAGTTQVPFFAALGGFADLSDRVGQIGGKQAYAPGIWQTTQVKGQDGVWAVPWFTEARAIYYRKDVLDKAGVDPSTAFSTWDNFRATLQKIKGTKINGKEIEPFGTPGKKAFDLVHHVMPFVWDAGGSELTADAKKSSIASPQAAQGVEFMADLVKDGLFDRSQLERDGTQVENQFKAGKLAVIMSGPWTLGSVDRSDDENWVPAARKSVGIAPMPAGPSGKAYTFVGGSNLMMFKSSKHQEQAWALMKYLSQDSVQTQYAAIQGMFPARLSAQEAQGAKDANNGAFLKAIQQGRTYATIPQWAQIETAYKTRFGDILDKAAGEGSHFSNAEVNSELQAAAKDADALLAQSTG